MLVNQLRPTRSAASRSSLPATSRLRRYVAAIAQPRHCRAQPRANARARELVADLLVSWGYTVELQGPYRNVVALPRKPFGELIAICAHYDSVPTTPGADDNGSGVAVMLEVAQAAAMAGTPVAVLAFNAEEDGLAGSRDFVRAQRGHNRWPIRLAHVLEMVGFTGPKQRVPMLPRWLPTPVPEVGDFLGLVADQRSATALCGVLRCARRLSSAPPVVALRTYLGVERLMPDTGRSDHAPFWAAGIPAVLWTDTGDFRSPHYHGPTDVPDTLDYDFMTRVASLLSAVCNEHSPVSSQRSAGDRFR